MSVKNELIKIAYSNPELRGELLPLILKVGSGETIEGLKKKIEGFLKDKEKLLEGPWTSSQSEEIKNVGRAARKLDIHPKSIEAVDAAMHDARVAYDTVLNTKIEDDADKARVERAKKNFGIKLDAAYEALKGAEGTTPEKSEVHIEEWFIVEGPYLRHGKENSPIKSFTHTGPKFEFQSSGGVTYLADVHKYPKRNVSYDIDVLLKKNKVSGLTKEILEAVAAEAEKLGMLKEED